MLILLMILGVIYSSYAETTSAMPMGLKTVLPGILFYSLLAAWFICLGIGSIKVRRWARILSLAGSWIWLFTGTAGFVWVLLVTPDIYSTMSETGQIPPEMTDILKYFTFGFSLVIYIVLPGILILFYGREDVKNTCEKIDPAIRWTDKCPLPVLALSLTLGFGGISIAGLFFYGSAVPFFGTIICGTAGSILLAITILFLAYLSWGSYRLKMNAWRGTFVFTIIGSISIVITFLRIKLFEFYEKMNFPENQIEMMQQFNFMKNQDFALYMGFISLAYLLFILYTHKYFAALSGIDLEKPDEPK